MGVKDGYIHMNTPWAKSYFKVLSRVEGVKITEPKRLSAGVPQRSLAIPLTEVYEDYKMPAKDKQTDEEFWSDPPPF